MGGTFKEFGKWSRAAFFHINGGGGESGMRVECRRELGVEDWGVGREVRVQETV